MLPPTLAVDTAQVGVDIGGTATRFVSVDAHGRLLAQWVSPTPNALTSDAAVNLLCVGIDTVLAGRHPAVIGIGASGPIDAQGIIRNPDTLPVFTGMDLVGALRARYQVACAIENDAVAAAYGEYALGAARACAGLLMITLGTGVGVCMLQNGVAVRGADGVHPESGHMRVDGPAAPCYCGKSVCWEQLASRTALQAQAATLFPQADGLASIQQAREAAMRGDANAQNVFNRYGMHVASGLVNLLTLYRPDAVVIGGAGAQYLDLFEKPLLAEVTTSTGVFPTFSLSAAALADLGGALGAAMWARKL